MMLTKLRKKKKTSTGTANIGVLSQLGYRARSMHWSGNCGARGSPVCSPRYGTRRVDFVRPHRPWHPCFCCTNGWWTRSSTLESKRHFAWSHNT
jgi:hypothetical protein